MTTLLCGIMSKLIAITKVLIERKALFQPYTPTKKLPTKYYDPRTTKPCHVVTYT